MKEKTRYRLTGRKKRKNLIGGKRLLAFAGYLGRADSGIRVR